MIYDAIGSLQWLGPKGFTRKMEHYERKIWQENNIITKKERKKIF